MGQPPADAGGRPAGAAWRPFTVFKPGGGFVSLILAYLLRAEYPQPWTRAGATCCGRAVSKQGLCGLQPPPARSFTARQCIKQPLESHPPQPSPSHLSATALLQFSL